MQDLHSCVSQPGIYTNRTVLVAATKAYAEKLREAVATTFLALEGQFVLTGQLSGEPLNT